MHKVDFLKWLDGLASGKEDGNLEVAISNLPSEFQNLASSLLTATRDESAKPSAKIKIEQLSETFLKKFTDKCDNVFYLILILCHDSSSHNLRKSILSRLSQQEINEEKQQYLLNRLASIRDESEKQVLWNLTLASNLLQSASGRDFQLAFLEWGISQRFLISNPVDTFLGLRDASDQFVKISANHQIKIAKKLLDLDVFVFIVFVLHIAKANLSLAALTGVLKEREREFLLEYFENRMKLQGPWSIDFESAVISPFLKSTVDLIMNFEELLHLLPYLSVMGSSNLSESFSRAVARCFRREDELAAILTDKRVGLLEEQVDALSQERNVLSAKLANEIAKVEDLEKKGKVFEAAIESYENRLRNHMKSENRGTDALTQTAKAEILKNVVSGLDHLFYGQEGLLLEKALQKVGIQRLGTPNDQYIWDSATCETLTGEEISTGIVVHSGYTWLDGNRKVIIRRVLLKKG